MSAAIFTLTSGTNLCLSLCGQKKLSEKVQDGIAVTGHLFDHALVIGVVALGIIGLLTHTLPVFSIGLIGAGLGYGAYLLIGDVLLACAKLIGEKELVEELTPGFIIKGKMADTAIAVGAIAIGTIGLLTHIFPLLSIGLIGFGVGISFFALQATLILSYQYIESKVCK